MREPEIYGHTRLADIAKTLGMRAGQHQVQDFQTNHEGAMLDFIHQLWQNHQADWLIINMGAWTHTSIAIRDALLATQLPFVEVHISNIYQREPYRHASYTANIARACIVGMGVYGYTAALDYILHTSPAALS